MNLEKFTDRAKGFLQSAQTVAIRMNHQRITPLLTRRGPLTLTPGPSVPGSKDEARLMDLCEPSVTLRDLPEVAPETGDRIE